ncbi:MAG: 50S ribosomal protein L10, partial [Synergistaceae bacterium]|nr:50S ribosomal protein L10 [Synergistaceae bacterium]
YDDPVSVAKVLKDYVNDKTQKAFVLKGGELENQQLNLNQLMALAELPSKEALRGQVVRTIAAPISGFVNVLAGTIRNFVTCLDQVRAKKEETAA